MKTLYLDTIIDSGECAGETIQEAVKKNPNAVINFVYALNKAEGFLLDDKLIEDPLFRGHMEAEMRSRARHRSASATMWANSLGEY